MELKLSSEKRGTDSIIISENVLTHSLIERKQQKIDTAVIIAAGKGSRLNGHQNGLPKPLVKVGGIPLLTRVILSAKRTGVDNFVIVVGYLADKIIDAIEPEELGVNITWVYNSEWQRQNGVSVLEAEPYVDDRFFLFMSDHIFDTRILGQLHQNGLKDEDDGVLCVDYRTHRVPDLEDATKVYAEDNRLLELSKELSHFNAIDVGVFICRPALFDALRTSQAKGDDSLSGGIRVLAQQGKMATMDIGDAYWQDVDTVSDLHHAEALLLQSTRSKSDGPIARTINRPISNRISKWLLKTPITPSQISVFNLLVSIISGALLATGRPLFVALGGVLFQLTSILDGCDGEVAVMKLRDSKSGALVDTVTDQLSYIAFVVGVAVGAYQVTKDQTIIAISGGTFVLLMLIFAAGYAFIKRKNSGSFRDLNGAIVSFRDRPQQVWYLRLFSQISPIGRRDMFAFLSFLILLTGNIVWFYWLMVTAILLMCIGISFSVFHMLTTSEGRQPLRRLKRWSNLLRDRFQQSLLPGIEIPFEDEVTNDRSSSEKFTIDQ